MRSPSRAVLCAFSIVVSLAVPAAATSPRVFMSQTGNDANDCSNPLTPCVDFAGALAQVSVDGEVIAETTGPYGPLTITQGVTISGPEGVVLYSHQPVTINAPGAKVIIRGMTIDGASNAGITINAAGSMFIENCVISGNQGLGGVVVSAGVTTELAIQHCTIRNNSADGVLVFPGGTALTITDCQLTGNGFHNVEIQSGKAVISGSTISHAAEDGIVAFNTAVATIERCVITGNVQYGVSTASGGIARVSDSTITHNGTGLDNISGTLSSRGNNTVIDNLTQTAGTISSFGGV
jgi:hypothetical protein